MNNGGFPYSSDNKRYHTLAWHFGQVFGGRVHKIPVNIGATCPNRDGSKGRGGCAFCSGSGSGEFAGRAGESLRAQLEHGLGLLRNGRPCGRYIIYFQPFSNTYMPLGRLREWAEEALLLPGAVGLAIATRADCVAAETAGYLGGLSRRCRLYVELGLQTVHDETAERLNRCHSYKEFLEGYELLRSHGIQTCVHLMNGLPGEDKAMMLETARRVGRLEPHSVKLHMLCVLRGTELAEEYARRPFPLLSGEEYVDILCGQLELMPPGTVIQRITGDPPKNGLVTPAWTKNKLWVRNALDREMARRDTVQGAKFMSDSGYIV